MSQFTDYPNSTSYFIYANNLTDVEISGGGTIDGQGADWWSPLASSRPYMVYFNKANRVLVQDITLQNPPKMHMVFKSTDGNITIRNITINTTAANAKNTDGIDLIGTNCLVQNCVINAGDDNIALGSSAGVTADVLITNCTFGVGYGVSIGSNTSGGVSNLIVIDCTFNGTDYGIRMKSDNATSGGSGQGGVAQNLSYLNIGMTNILRGAIVIYSYYSEYGTPTSITPTIASTQSVDSLNIPIWHNITISNVTALVSSNGTTPGIAGIIWGLIETPASNIKFSHVNITAPKSFDVYNANGVQFLDSQITVPNGNSTYTLYNADITVSNSTPNAPLVTFDGLTSVNTLTLSHAPAAMTANDVFGANPITLDASTLTVSNTLTLPGATAVNFTLGTNNAKIMTTGNLSLNSTLNISAGDGFGAGTYTLFTYGGNLSGNPALSATPAGYNYSINTNTHGQVQLIVRSPTPPSPPDFDSVNIIDGTNLVINGSGGTTNGMFYVLATTNLTLPLNQWMHMATNQFNGVGNFAFTNGVSSSPPQMFYLLQLP